MSPGYSPADGRGRGRHAGERFKALRRELIDPADRRAPRPHRQDHRRRAAGGVRRASSMRVRCAVEVQGGMAERNAGYRGRAAHRIPHRHQSRRHHRRGRRHLRRRGQCRGAARRHRRAGRDLRLGAWCRQDAAAGSISLRGYGRAALKNIARPVRVYRVDQSRPPASPACGEVPSAAAPRRSDHPARPARQAVDRGAAVPEYERRPGAGIFRRRHGRGHHHRAVAAIRWLFVIARNSTFTYKGRRST